MLKSRREGIPYSSEDETMPAVDETDAATIPEGNRGMTDVPEHSKIYHIMHVDRLTSIIADGCLWCDAEIVRRASSGTTIGMNQIKERRLHELTLASHPDLHVGDCVPFYFCPRSVMLYMIHRGNHPELTYLDGQEFIVHLEADLYTVVALADQNDRRWAFTSSNAGSYYFEDWCDLGRLDQIDWVAVQARDWQDRKDGKQAEFLFEYSFPWPLVERIGVINALMYTRVMHILTDATYKPRVEIQLDWYY